MTEEKEKKYIWLDKKEFLDNSVERRHLILKIFYYLGMYRFRDLTEYAEKHKKFISPDKKQIHRLAETEMVSSVYVGVCYLSCNHNFYSRILQDYKKYII